MAQRARCLHVLLTAFGSRGDVLPRVALARALRARGHRVAIACAPRWHPTVTRYGLTPVKLGDYPPEEVTARAYARMAHELDPGRRGEMLLRELLVPMYPGLRQELLATQGAFDLVVLNDLLAPLAVPPLIDAARLAVALTTQPVGGFAHMLRGSPLVKLVASSPMLLPPDHGLDESFVITDFWLPDPPSNVAVDPALAGFLSSPGPTIAVALGSAWGTDPALARPMLVRAARRAGVRLVVQDFAAASGRPAVDAAGRVISIGEVPYAWLFERVDAVVHHGGAGTIAEALRAGCPSITVPHYGDHLYWAYRLEAAALSAGTILPRELDERTLIERMERAVHDQALRVSAEEAASRFDHTRGVAAAADRIEVLVPAAIASG